MSIPSSRKSIRIRALSEPKPRAYA
jgi:hypothetical protein